MTIPSSRSDTTGSLRSFRYLTGFSFSRPICETARRCALDVRPGARVLEIGCGSGRNFPSLQRVVGPTGRIYGVDISAGMLARARARCKREGWNNVELTRCDAAEYMPPEPFDGILFGLSYNTMPHHRVVLQHSWNILRPGGRIVIMDGKAPPGRMGQIFLPFGVWLMRHTLLGNPFIKPWKHLADLAQDFAMEEFVFGSWYVCWGSKPKCSAASDIGGAREQLAPE
jgi:ubiquinone/menaquinone biosynthesis C-methylase UbiE